MYPVKGINSSWLIVSILQASAGALLTQLEKEKELLRIFLRVSQMENTVLRRMNLPAFLMVSAHAAYLHIPTTEDRWIGIGITKITVLSYRKENTTISISASVSQCKLITC
jgi:hypothetical protein